MNTIMERVFSVFYLLAAWLRILKPARKQKSLPTPRSTEREHTLSMCNFVGDINRIRKSDEQQRFPARVWTDGRKNRKREAVKNREQEGESSNQFLFQLEASKERVEVV